MKDLIDTYPSDIHTRTWVYRLVYIGRHSCKGWGRKVCIHFRNFVLCSRHYRCTWNIHTSIPSNPTYSYAKVLHKEIYKNIYSIYCLQFLLKYFTTINTNIWLNSIHMEILRKYYQRQNTINLDILSPSNNNIFLSHGYPTIKLCWRQALIRNKTII